MISKTAQSLVVLLVAAATVLAQDLPNNADSINNNDINVIKSSNNDEVSDISDNVNDVNYDSMVSSSEEYYSFDQVDNATAKPDGSLFTEGKYASVNSRLFCLAPMKQKCFSLQTL